MQIWGLTDPGNIRSQNQDAYNIVEFGHDRALMIVCDGMGGAKSGNVASSMAAEAFVAEVRRSQRLALSVERVKQILLGALELANKAVYEHAKLGDEYSGMGTTLVAAFLLKTRRSSSTSATAAPITFPRRACIRSRAIIRSWS